VYVSSGAVFGDQQNTKWKKATLDLTVERRPQLLGEKILRNLEPNFDLLQ